MGILGNNARMQTVPEDIGYWSYGGLPQANPQGRAAMIQPPPQPAAPPQQNPQRIAGLLAALSSQFQRAPQAPQQAAPQSSAQPPQGAQAFSGGGRARMDLSALVRGLRAPRVYAEGGATPGKTLASLRALMLHAPHPKQSLAAAQAERMREFDDNTDGYANLPDADMWAAYRQRNEMLMPRNRIRGGDRFAAAQPFAGAGAVAGPGTGRSDDINAKLSDGEYVIDSTSVALLGDGSNKAGAERLDELRKHLRMHKGKSLVKGEFGPDAKMPWEYLPK